MPSEYIHESDDPLTLRCKRTGRLIPVRKLHDPYTDEDILIAIDNDTIFPASVPLKASKSRTWMMTLGYMNNKNVFAPRELIDNADLQAIKNLTTRVSGEDITEIGTSR